VFLRAEQKRKTEEKLYNAWILVVPPVLRHVLLLAYFCIALELKICARLGETKLGASVTDKTQEENWGRPTAHSINPRETWHKLFF
jgi:hypothetical protein